MKPVELICWGRLPGDTRDTASATIAFTLSPSSKLSPAKAARLLDSYGQAAIKKSLAGQLTPAAHNRPDATPATWHGVTVVYQSGRTRKYRGD